MIVARAPGGMRGSSYLYRDETASPGRVYSYWLEVTLLSGTTERYGPVAIRRPVMAKPENYDTNSRSPRRQ
jgi:hypothetical protein